MGSNERFCPVPLLPKGVTGAVSYPHFSFPFSPREVYTYEDVVNFISTHSFFVGEGMFGFD